MTVEPQHEGKLLHYSGKQMIKSNSLLWQQMVNKCYSNSTVVRIRRSQNTFKHSSVNDRSTVKSASRFTNPLPRQAGVDYWRNLTSMPLLPVKARLVIVTLLSSISIPAQLRGLQPKALWNGEVWKCPSLWTSCQIKIIEHSEKFWLAVNAAACTACTYNQISNQINIGFTISRMHYHHVA